MENEYAGVQYLQIPIFLRSTLWDVYYFLSGAVLRSK